MNDEQLLSEAFTVARRVKDMHPEYVRDEVESELLVVIAECYCDYQRGRTDDAGWTAYVEARCRKRAARTAGKMRLGPTIARRAAALVAIFPGKLADEFVQWARDGRKGAAKD